MKTIKLISVIAGAALFLASCGTNKTSEEQAADGKLTGAVNIDGSSTVYPITEAVAEEFKKVHPDVKVAVALSGTGGGFKKFGRGETDINDASRPIKSAEDSAAKAHNVSYIDLLVAYDGMAVVVNPQNNWCNDMTVTELKMLWAPEAQGKIKKWNQIRKEWPNEEIHLFGAGVESGTYDYFTEAIVGKSHSSRGDYTASEDDNVLVQGIASDKYALGFFGLAYYEENMDKLKVIGIDDGKDDNGTGPIVPTVETVKNKTYSPLGRPLFIYVNDVAGKRKEVQEFVRFYLANMNTLSKEVGYVPLTDDETEAEKSKWENFVKSVSEAK
ncbi:MAG TPA: PstS family phosphate ABC transporter substrate-binding protein [Bacteroidia bacterium]|nr:PstS family phosphate ABC transporter substrate-binding protein [Bacteroidia bacterium]